MPKKICFTGSGLTGLDPSGVQRYTFEILKAMDRMVKPGEVELLITDRDTDYSFHNIKTVNLYDEKFKSSVLARIMYSDKPLLKRLRRKLKKSSVVYNHYFFRDYVKKNDAVYVDLLQLFPHIGCDVTAIHDCIPEVLAEQFPKGSMPKLRKRKVKNAVKRAKRIVSVSNTSVADIRKYYPTEKEIVVIPNAWQHMETIPEEKTVMERIGLQERGYFYTVGNVFPHKNFKWIECAARDNPEDLFVVTGKVYDKEGISQDSSAGNVIFTGYISDGEIKCLMKNCKAFILPSFIEGFGLPPLEAMSVGADCILSNCSAFREIYGDSVWYIDPAEYDNISMEEIMSRDKAQNELILNKYSWEMSAESVLNIIRGI